jgi:hypothetical protein
VMRHFLVPGPVTGLPGCMGRASAPGALITPACVTQALASNAAGAIGRAVALSVIAVAADDDLGATTCAEKETASGL